MLKVPRFRCTAQSSIPLIILFHSLATTTPINNIIINIKHRRHLFKSSSSSPTCLLYPRDSSKSNVTVGGGFQGIHLISLLHHHRHHHNHDCGRSSPSLTKTSFQRFCAGKRDVTVFSSRRGLRLDVQPALGCRR